MTTQTTAPAPARLDVRPVTPVIGAEVHGIDLREPLDDVTVAELRDALVQWKVLFFRDQSLDSAQHRDFAASGQELVGDIFAGLLGDLEVVAADEGRVVLSGIADGLAVEQPHPPFVPRAQILRPD